MASSSQASSSSSMPPRGRTYDIFLSFRGEDTRNNFVDHLYAALLQKGIHTFKDDKILGGGKPISESLLKAIKESKFAVIVFSKDYANSSWCLDELSEIMECHDRIGLKVLPVFYHLDPSDVRKQKGNFATSFQEHELSFNGGKNEVNKWREALTAAASLSGYHISPVSGGETATINKIVQEILGDMRPRGRETNLIGIELQMERLNSLLSIKETDEVRIIGIFGMGGIGKTTIARAIYKRIANSFEGSSFVSNVRENSSSKRDICLLQEKILRDVLAAHHGFSIQDPEYGADMIHERFCNKKVLLVLDDVDDIKQLEFLAAEHGWFGPGSRIIITTRDERLLSYANERYKPALLRMEQALELFSRHAFKENYPPEEFKELSNRAISYTGRLPLALKVLGSFFFERDIDAWESALDRLTKTPNSEIIETLRLSFDGLEESEKKIFLDIAFFFKGREVDDVTRVLDSFDYFAGIGLRVLIEKSLITVSKNRLDMHDLIQEMGWQVVRKSAPDSRLLTIKTIHDIISENKKLELIEAIVNPLAYSTVHESFEATMKRWRDNFFHHKPCSKEHELSKAIVKWWQHKFFHHKRCSADVFKLMKNLRLLHVEGNFTCCQPTFLPHELRWLQWTDYPFSSLPLANMSKLVGLDMDCAKIKHLWRGQKSMLHLKFIQLNNMDRLSRFPNVSGAPNIEMVALLHCENLVEVHESLGLLKRLVYLDMSYCKKLKCLSSRFETESLETLIISHCFSLERLPEFSPCMVKLSHLAVKNCYRLKELPSSIRNVSNLSILNLSWCTHLNNILDSICELKSLMTLSFKGCSNVQKLPNEFGNTRNLQEVHLGQAKSFSQNLTNLYSLRKLDLSCISVSHQDFPINLDGFPSSEELDLSFNSKLMKLPASISYLSCLRHLCLSYCDQLQDLRGLPPGIQVLEARNCISLEVIEDLSKKYKWLYKINLFGCKELLTDKQNERYLDNMLKQSFLKKWATTDGCLSISIPGSKIPPWFKEQQKGSKITLKLPFKWQTEILGFAICGVFASSRVYPSIMFRFENSGTSVPMLGYDYFDANARRVFADDESKHMCIVYVPLCLLENMHHIDDEDDCKCENWSHIIEGNLIIGLPITSIFSKTVRIGAQVVYKEDVESTKQIIEPSISSSYYWSWKLTHHRWARNTIVCDFGYEKQET